MTFNPAHDKILVSADPEQKTSMKIGNFIFTNAPLFEPNYRYRSPTICTVIKGNPYVKEGDNLLVHHNLLYLPSPHHIGDNIFAIPFSKVLFAIIEKDGELTPICSNILGERIDIKYNYAMGELAKKQYEDRMIVSKSSDPHYRKGQTIFARPASCYEIIYQINGVQKSAIKISSDMVCGVLSTARPLKFQ